MDALLEIATTMHELGTAGKDGIESDPEKLKVLFTEMVQMCLWGNATVSIFLPDYRPFHMKGLFRIYLF